MPPKSRLPPVQTKGLKFGSGSSSQASSVNSTSKDQKKKVEEDGNLPFLDHICCNVCNEPFFDGIAKGRVFWMTSCAHIICNSEEHELKDGICTVCGKKMQAVTMEEGNLQPIQERYLSNPESQLEQMVSELHAFEEKLKVVKGIYRFQTNQHKKPRSFLLEEIQKLRAELERSRNDCDIHATENVELKLANKELQARLDMPPPPINGFTTPRQSMIPNPNYTGRLPTVYEAGEEDELSHNSGGSLGKRQRLGLGDQQPRSFVPSTPMASQQHYSQLLGTTYQPPQSQFERPRTAGGYSSSTPISPSKPDPERYRYNSTPLNGTSPQAFSQGSMNSQHVSMERPGSAFGSGTGGGYMGGYGSSNGGAGGDFRQTNGMTDQNYRGDPHSINNQYGQGSYHQDYDLSGPSTPPLGDHEGREGGKFVMSQAPKRPLPPPF